MSFIYYNPNPLDKRTSDCVVRAVSRLFEISWDDAYDDLSDQGKIDKAPFTVDDVWGNYLYKRGYMMYLLPNTCPRCLTVRDFCYTHPEGRYMLKTSGHVIAVVDGNYYDSSDSGNEVPIYYWTRSVSNGY